MLSEKKIELIASKLFRELGNGKSFLIGDLSKVVEPVRKLLKETANEEAARELMIANINKYEKQ